MLFRMIIRIPN